MDYNRRPRPKGAGCGLFAKRDATKKFVTSGGDRIPALLPLPPVSITRHQVTINTWCRYPGIWFQPFISSASLVSYPFLYFGVTHIRGLTSGIPSPYPLPLLFPLRRVFAFACAACTASASTTMSENIIFVWASMYILKAWNMVFIFSFFHPRRATSAVRAVDIFLVLLGLKMILDGIPRPVVPFPCVLLLLLRCT